MDASIVVVMNPREERNKTSCNHHIPQSLQESRDLKLRLLTIWGLDDVSCLVATVDTVDLGPRVFGRYHQR